MAKISPFVFKNVGLNKPKSANVHGDYIYIREDVSGQNGLYKLECIATDGREIITAVLPGNAEIKTVDGFYKEFRITPVSGNLATFDYTVIAGVGDVRIDSSGESGGGGDTRLIALEAGDICRALTFQYQDSDAQGISHYLYTAVGNDRILSNFSLTRASMQGFPARINFAAHPIIIPPAPQVGLISNLRSGAGAFVDTFSSGQSGTGLPSGVPIDSTNFDSELYESKFINASEIYLPQGHTLEIMVIALFDLYPNNFKKLTKTTLTLESRNP